MMNRQKRYYVSENDVTEFVDKITKIQAKKGEYVNITVKPYKGEKYGAGTKVIIVG